MYAHMYNTICTDIYIYIYICMHVEGENIWRNVRINSPPMGSGASLGEAQAARTCADVCSFVLPAVLYDLTSWAWAPGPTGRGQLIAGGLQLYKGYTPFGERGVNVSRPFGFICPMGM